MYLCFTLQGDSRSINALVRSFISERKHEDIPSVRKNSALLHLSLLDESFLLGILSALMSI